MHTPKSAADTATAATQHDSNDIRRRGGLALSMASNEAPSIMLCIFFVSFFVHLIRCSHASRTAAASMAAKNEMAKTIFGIGDASLGVRGAVHRHTKEGYQERWAMVHRVLCVVLLAFS